MARFEWGDTAHLLELFCGDGGLVAVAVWVVEQGLRVVGSSDVGEGGGRRDPQGCVVVRWFRWVGHFNVGRCAREVFLAFIGRSDHLRCLLHYLCCCLSLDVRGTNRAERLGTFRFLCDEKQ